MVKVTAIKSVLLVVVLLMATLSVGGCRVIAPALEGIAGAECGPEGPGPSKTSMMLRQWARDSRSNERCIDEMFFNYSVNDPYRGDCLAGY